MYATKPYKFIRFGAMYATKPYTFTGFGAMYATKPYKFRGFGAMYASEEVHRPQSRVVSCQIGFYIFF